MTGLLRKLPQQPLTTILQFVVVKCQETPLSIGIIFFHACITNSTSTALSEAWIAFLEFVVIVMGRVASFIAGQKGSHGG